MTAITFLLAWCLVAGWVALVLGAFIGTADYSEDEDA